MRKLVSFDWALKRLLRSKANFAILEGFLSELLYDDIIILEILEGESNKDHRLDRYNRVDVKVKNSKEEILIIEVQFERELDYFQRILYGTARVITEHLTQSDPYINVVKVISISILYFDLGHGIDYIYYGRTVFKGINKGDELQLSDLQKEVFNKDNPADLYSEYYLLKINQFNDIAKNTLDEWMFFLKNEEIKENFTAKGLKKAKEELDIMKLSDEERALYMRYSDDLHYQASMYQSTYVTGHLEGKKEGKAEGEKKAKLEIAKSLLDVLDVETIAKKTGLTVEEIKKLKVDINADKN